MPEFPSTRYQLGTVTTVNNETVDETPAGSLFTQSVTVRRPDGREETLQLGSEFQPLTADQRLSPGQTIILAETPDQPPSFADHYRLPVLLGLALVFFAAVAIVARRQGILAVIGMLISLAVLVLFVVPQILSGANPVLLSLAGAVVIGCATIYLSHGWNVRSHVALGSILLTMVVVALLSHGAVISARLSGLGSEEAAFLQFLGTGQVNLRGLLLGGIMLGALGVLDDIAVSQVAVVFELASAKPHIRFAELFHRAYAVGKTHVASLVNTLVLAYAGANLPLFLLFLSNPVQPPWVALNSEIIAEELVRTLAGSIGLVLAVPLTTALACLVRLSNGELGRILGVDHDAPAHGHQH